MDPRLVRISKSYRRSRTRFEIPLAIEAHGPGTIQQIADWTGLDSTRVEWALYGSDPTGSFRPSASLVTIGVVAEQVGRGGNIFPLTDLGLLSLAQARLDPAFARPRARRVAEIGMPAGSLHLQ